jgi:hypothetical protein
MGYPIDKTAAICEVEGCGHRVLSLMSGGSYCPSETAHPGGHVQGRERLYQGKVQEVWRDRAKAVVGTTTAKRVTKVKRETKLVPSFDSILRQS